MIRAGRAVLDLPSLDERARADDSRARGDQARATARHLAARAVAEARPAGEPGSAAGASCGCGPAEPDATAGASCGRERAVARTNASGEQVFGGALYQPGEADAAPAAAVAASLGCGVPTAVADLREGETVLDLGWGRAPTFSSPPAVSDPVAKRSALT